MPNPFPGMNPYLENPLHWRGVHLRLIAALDAQLNQTLPPDFVSRVEERVYVESAAQRYYPDGIVVETPRRASSGGVAVLERPLAQTYDAPKILELGAIKFRERYLEIRTIGSGELIAVIEFVSPANKTFGSGRQEYLRKQHDVLHSRIHLLEIDLLRAGEPVVAPFEFGAQSLLGKYDYLISLHRGGDKARFEAWTPTLRERLPRLHLPLTEEAGEVYPDLQAFVNHAYENGGGDRAIDYRDEPIPPLRAEDAKWVDALLREKGLR